MSPTALSFLLQEKRQRRKECLDAFGASCACSLGKHLFYSLCEYTYSPYGRFGTRRLLRYGQICESLPLNGCGKSALRPKFYSVVRIRRNPYKSFSNSVRNSELLQISRERSKKTEAVFLVGSRRSGGKSSEKISRARCILRRALHGMERYRQVCRMHRIICAWPHSSSAIFSSIQRCVPAFSASASYASCAVCSSE